MRCTGPSASTPLQRRRQEFLSMGPKIQGGLGGSQRDPTTLTKSLDLHDYMQVPQVVTAEGAGAPAPLA